MREVIHTLDLDVSFDDDILSTLVNPVNQVTQSAGVACRASVQVPAALLIVAGSEALALLV